MHIQMVTALVPYTLRHVSHGKNHDHRPVKKEKKRTNSTVRDETRGLNPTIARQTQQQQQQQRNIMKRTEGEGAERWGREREVSPRGGGLARRLACIDQQLTGPYRARTLPLVRESFSALSLSLSLSLSLFLSLSSCLYNTRNR